MSVHNGWNSILLSFRGVPTKCQPLCFGAGEQHPARPERVFVQNRRLGVDLSALRLRGAYASPMPEGVVCVGLGLGLGLGLGFEKFENINRCCRPEP